MKLFKNHNKRVAKIKKFSGNNKVFIITALIAIVFIIYNLAFVNNDNSHEERQEVSIIENGETETVDSSEIEQSGWRFYFIDLIILGAGSGGCLIMILRERKRTKEGLK